MNKTGGAPQAELELCVWTVPGNTGMVLSFAHHVPRLGAFVTSTPMYALNTKASFLVKPNGTLHFAVVQNAPFTRPDLDDLLSGISFTLDKDYPTRGTLT